MAKKYDFSGYATKNDLRCTDGRTIRKNAFAHQDGQRVPLVWGHLHDDPDKVLGHAILENREDGVYTYGSFNDTEQGQTAKKLVTHGDVVSLSIYANHLKQNGGDVMHGTIREVSLVLAGANPGATIENLYVMHEMDEDDLDELIAFSDEGSCEIELSHADEEGVEKVENKEPIVHEDEETVEDVINSMSEKQQKVMFYMIDQAVKNAGELKQSDDNEDNYEGGEEMKHHVFENEDHLNGQVLSHDDMKELMAGAIADAKKGYSLRESIISHAATYGIEDIDILFPDARALSSEPDFIKRRTEWVTKVVDGAKHSPFSRIKSIHADITADEARAKGYVKGKKKLEEVFTLLKRSTEPQTVYKKQKLDRDDILDITDFNVVMFVKGEMRIMLDEELGRAALIGDGRLASSDDKIKEDHIRPIWKDDDLYSMKYEVAANDAEAFIDSVVTAMADYEGSGAPTLFAPQNIITACLLLKDTNKHRLYKTMQELATAMMVSEIVPVEVMKNQTRTNETGDTLMLDAIIVNMKDYTFGSDKGGAVTAFEDFDIDYNQQKYLLETRVSGALTKPKSALVFEHKTA